VDALKNSIVRLFGPGAGGQINASMIHAYSYQDLISYLNDPLGSAALGVNLDASQWVLLVMQDSSVARPETDAVTRLLSERSDLIREKKVIGFAFNAPYYLDATDIAKLTAYFGIYSKISAFMDVAARVLFQELSPVGALPVSVPGVGYDL
jgi:beta-N-acetylhexosaminidase